MQVILKKDISSLGRIGDLVKVRDGYARNYLLPRSLAVVADDGNVKKLEHQKRIVEIHKKKVQKESEGVAEKLKDVSIKIKKAANEAGKMFGSITPNDVAAELKKKGHEFDRRDIELESFKEAGEYDVKVRLPGDVYGSIKLVLELTVKKEKKSAAKKKTTTKKKAGAKKESEASAEDAGEAASEEKKAEPKAEAAETKETKEND